jgi:hypothetical protein
MKIRGISDTHGNLPYIKPCNVLCICGDILPLDIQENAAESFYWLSTAFFDWLNSLTVDCVLYVPGNHDFCMQDEHLRKLVESHFADSSFKFAILVNESYTYEGIHFYGTPYINPITFQKGVWAFESAGSYDIPECDVLLSHDSPLENPSLGHAALSKYKYAHFYGHWHTDQHRGGSKQLNCAYVNDYYSVKSNFEPPTIEIEEPDEQDGLIRQDVLDAVEWDTSADIETPEINEKDDN